MAVGVQMDFRNATIDQYDEVTERLGYLPGGPGPPGVLFHWVTKTDDGFRIIDVCESRAEFEKLLTEKIIPTFREAGVLDPPETEFFEVHSYLVGSHRI
jgi:hypothetical protein